MFERGWEVNFNYLPRRGESENFKRGESMVHWQVFLKKVGLALFLFNFSFLHSEITLLFPKLCYAFKEKLFFLP